MKISNHGKFIGVVSEIVDDNTLRFITNNNSLCKISSTIAIESGKNSIVIGVVKNINVYYHTPNHIQFLISKANSNEVQGLTESINQPRFAYIYDANIVGHYQQDENQMLIEDKDSIDKYTPVLFQSVYQIYFEKILNLYGLYKKSQNPLSSFSLGSISYPDISCESVTDAFFNLNVFNSHTLITGVTGSGKSMLANIIAQQLATLGAHISILDPHNEYTDKIRSSKTYHVNKYHQYTNIPEKGSKINCEPIKFFEKDLTPDILTHILPALTVQQSNAIFDLMNEYEYNLKFNLRDFLDFIIDEYILGNELSSIAKAHELEILYKKRDFLIRHSKNHESYVNKYLNWLKGEIKDNHARKVDVYIAIVLKINDLRNKMVTSKKQNWLNESPYSIDILQLDYSSNEYTKRFVNSFFSYLLRNISTDKFRIIVIEEAHMLLKLQSSTPQLLEQVLREGRKFNLSFIFISQNSTDIPESIISQFQNIFSFREKNSITQNYADQLCRVRIFGSKSSFSMRVRDANKAF